jgi:hypothetical protein
MDPSQLCITARGRYRGGNKKIGDRYSSNDNPQVDYMFLENNFYGRSVERPFFFINKGIDKIRLLDTITTMIQLVQYKG